MIAATHRTPAPAAFAWLDDLVLLLNKFGDGIGHDLSYLAIDARWGLYRHLHRLDGEQRSDGLEHGEGDHD